MNKKEFRTADLAASDGDMKVSGYAAVFESPTVLANIFGEDYKEVIQRGAFEGADMSDVVLRYNHNDSFQILARTSNGTLSLVPDERGLKVEATLANTTAGRDVYELIKRKDITKMSFAFSVREASFDTATNTRKIIKFDTIYDVSAVDVPAYDDTYISEVRKSLDEDARNRIIIFSMM